jgi:hypothetical protein
MQTAPCRAFRESRIQGLREYRDGESTEMEED